MVQGPLLLAKIRILQSRSSETNLSYSRRRKERGSLLTLDCAIGLICWLSPKMLPKYICPWNLQAKHKGRTHRYNHEPIVKAFAKIRPEPGLKQIEADRPLPGYREVLVKVKVTSVCGTDYHIYRWDEWAQEHIKPPRIIGHEFAGEVVEVGPDVTSRKIGDMVAAESHIACGTCYQCRTGNSHICERLRIIGVDVDGSFAEYVKIPEQNAWPIPREIPTETASILEPLGNAVHAAFAADIAGNDVTIFGCGPVGLSAVALTNVSGALSVTAVDINEYRLRLASRMGASKTINSKERDAVAEIHADTEGR